ncbi:hypothetical protein Y032_0010g908 [Ancylostoma ceylanicum]|uniref:Amiloride-sensitive sodium channel n=1 Tax=Ancylostoma ceylanicum TaxID=53326 RepID=A0A016VGD8_9BILA|nr:hypothetical protein Y032_0010g908 [Ancylostoma ceylanicum]
MEEEDDELGSTSTYSDDDTQRIVLHVYDDESREFASLTTYHGMIRIYSSETWPSRIFWSLVVVTCLTLFMIHSALMLLFYHSHPTFFKTTNILLNDEHLPLVTVCKIGGAGRWKSYPEIETRKDLLTVFDSVLLGASLDSTEIRELHLLEEIYLNSTKTKFKMRKFLLENRSECDEFVTSVHIGDRLMSNHCKRAHWSFTDLGYCSTFTWENSSSTSHTLRIDVVSGTDEVVVFRIHPSNLAKAISSEGIYVARGKTTKLAIRAKKRIHLKANEWGDCMVESFPNVGGRYDRENCEIQCSVEHYKQQCGCIPFFAEKQDGRECTLAEMATCRRKELLLPGGKRGCLCPVECEKIDYTYSPVVYIKKHHRNRSSIEIQMLSRHLEVNEQLKRIKAVDLLSYVAGSMGLFLGMSCVTLLEIFVYLFKSVWGVFNDQVNYYYS